MFGRFVVAYATAMLVLMAPVHAKADVAAPVQVFYSDPPSEIVPDHVLTAQEQEIAYYEIYSLGGDDVDVPEDVPARGGGTYCFDGKVRMDAKSYAHIRLWSYIFRSSACVGWADLYHHVITNMRWERPFVNIPSWSLWEFIGQDLEAKRGGAGHTTAYRRYRGHFKVCLPIPGLGTVCHNKYPYVALRFFEDGHFTKGWGL